MGPSLDAPEAPVPARWPLVGRRVQLERLVAAVDGPWPRGMVLHGAPGVGKTRLATEVLAAVTATGRTGARVSASAALVGVPLGALAPLLPAGVLDRRTDPIAVYGHVAAALRTRSGDRPFIVLVDDAHRLDVSSIGLLGQLLDDDVVFLVATARTGEPVAAALTELWNREHLEHHEIGPLDEDALDTLLHLTLGGPVDAATRAALWSLSGGNVLFLRELVTAAATAGALVHRRGVWHLEGPLPPPRPLADLLDTRLATLDLSAAAAVELVAVGPVSLDELAVSPGDGVVETLERAGFVEVRPDGRRRPVVLTHPLYEELVRATMPTLTRQRLLRRRADTIEAHGARRHGDALAVADARLEAGEDVDPETVLRAARIARHAHDFAQVERFAGAAVAVAATPGAVLLLAEAKAELGACDDVEALLVTHEDLTRTAPAGEALLLVALRVRNLVYGCRRPADATAVNASARRRFGDEHPELLANEASIALFTGDPRRALAVARQVPGTDWRTAALRAFVEERALIAAGRCEEAAGLCERAFAAQSDPAGRPAWEETVAISHPGVHLIHRVHALTDAGRLAEARELADLGFRVSLGEGPPAGRVWFGWSRGRIDLLRGRPADARRSLAEAAALAGRWGYLAAHRLVLSLLAVAESWSGDAGAARAAVDELDRLPPFAYLEPEQRLGEAWTLVAEGDVVGARHLLAATAADALASGWRSSAAWLLHDLARLGDAPAAHEGLAGLADAEGPLVAARRAHAAALVTRSAPDLAAAADRFEALGAGLLAAEAYTAAAAAGAGDRRGATALRARAAALLEGLGPVTTPALPAGTAVDPLTAREREIATLAAARLSSREIGERLFLSTRTVDNHLQRIYAKLGVRGRRGLAAALAPDAPQPAGPGEPGPAG